MKSHRASKERVALSQTANFNARPPKLAEYCFSAKAAQRPMDLASPPAGAPEKPCDPFCVDPA
ncbi:hypothetical protein GGTG_13548 [Gaeumannomyces tritici R3-111a-1]|uniref:Uncharacterized protein n=1 Tax=Gaeumannomyces tritici (strain R3-111a-1) TaxID=644352 RepID=J3PJ66_GAET3|nr:hypothetical protein GGTG_13548 [Gaeumannomyces tritici R3-111a-1]EJT68884.1 hypothetical protein GGTG_13548 [Gaeumannomyces tritici R3-111a-1]